MKTTPKIEKNVPIHGNRAGRPPRWADLINKMQLGESVFFANKAEGNSFAMCARRKFAVVTRSEGTIEGKIGLRVWRKPTTLAEQLDQEGVWKK